MTNTAKYANQDLSQSVGASDFLMTHFELNGPTCSVKKKDIEGTSEGAQLQRGDATGVEVPWVNPQLLNFKTKFKQRVYRLLNKYAIQRGPTYVFVEDKYEEFEQKFNAIQHEYMSEARDFSMNIDSHIADYIQAKPHLEAFIRRFSLSSQELMDKFTFKMAVPTKLAAHDENEQDELVKEVEEGFWEQVKGSATSFLKNLSSREYGTQRALAPVRALSTLMVNNTAISNRVLTVAKSFYNFMKQLPQEGRVEGSEFTDVIRWMGVLASDVGADAMNKKEDIDLNSLFKRDADDTDEPQQAQSSDEESTETETEVEAEDTQAVEAVETEEEVEVAAQQPDNASQDEVSIEAQDDSEEEEEMEQEVNVMNSPFNGGVNTLF